MTGRKNFAMDFCKDLIFLSGGMDNGQNLLSEFMMFNPILGQWTELRQVRKKTEKKGRKGKDNAVSPDASGHNPTTINSSRKDYTA